MPEYYKIIIKINLQNKKVKQKELVNMPFLSKTYCMWIPWYNTYIFPIPELSLSFINFQCKCVEHHGRWCKQKKSETKHIPYEILQTFPKTKRSLKQWKIFPNNFSTVVYGWIEMHNVWSSQKISFFHLTQLFYSYIKHFPLYVDEVFDILLWWFFWGEKLWGNRKGISQNYNNNKNNNETNDGNNKNLIIHIVLH